MGILRVFKTFPTGFLPSALLKVVRVLTTPGSSPEGAHTGWVNPTEIGFFHFLSPDAEYSALRNDTSQMETIWLILPSQAVFKIYPINPTALLAE